jgi:hypothetical protein
MAMAAVLRLNALKIHKHLGIVPQNGRKMVKF